MIKLIRAIIKATGIISPKLSAAIAIELLFRPGTNKIKNKYQNFWDTGEKLSMPSGCEARIFGSGDKIFWVTHGWQSHSSRFEKIIKVANQHGYKVIAWNGPAHGNSPGHRTNLASFTRCLVKDVDSINQKVDIMLGHSFGAAASAYACNLGAKIEGLILLASPANAKEVFERFWDFIWLGARARKIFVKKTQEEMVAMLSDMSLDEFVNDLNQHICMVHDTKDKIIPYGDALRIKSLRPGVELHKTIGLGHYKIASAVETLDIIDGYLGKLSAEQATETINMGSQNVVAT